MVKKTCNKCGCWISPFMTSYEKGECENCEALFKNRDALAKNGCVPLDFM